MDTNGTRYHLLLGQDDWGACLDEQEQTLASNWLASPVMHNLSGLDWRAANFELTLQSRVFQFATSPYDDKLTLNRRRGAGRDRYGNWYWVGRSGVELRVQSSGTGQSSHFWSAGDGDTPEKPARGGDFTPVEKPLPPSPLPMAGLAVTEDHYLVVGVLEPKGLLVFDLHTSGSPRQLIWPESVPFAPYDMAPRPGGGVWILDRENRCYWGLDRKFNIIRLDQSPETQTDEIFQPLEGGSSRRTATRAFPTAIPLDVAAPLVTDGAAAIEALPDGTVLILDHQPGEAYSRILRYRWETLLGTASLSEVTKIVDQIAVSSFHLTGYDMAFLTVKTPRNPLQLGQVFIASFDGNQTYAFDLFSGGPGLQLQALPVFYPMRLFGGKAIVSANDRVYYDFNESWLPLIEQKRPRYEPQASLYTVALDGKAPDCIWHRLMLDACIPPDSRVQVWSRAANEPEALEHSPWWQEPELYRRVDGPELPFVTPSSARDAGTWEFLFQRASGRYLQLKITLSGNGRSTPRLSALRVYYPRFSYLEHYLPAVYREDENSASFLDRFLANLEGSLTTLEDRIANVQMLFDVRSVPSDVLEWLSGWLGMALDPAWDERRRRLFIRYAMEFFKYRGTMRGLLIALHLALDSCVDEHIFTLPLEFKASGSKGAMTHKLSGFRIIEKYRTRQTPPVLLGDPTQAEGLRVVVVAQRWNPFQGREVLNRRWQESSSGAGEYPIHDPGGKLSRPWQQFSQSVLGFVPSFNPSEPQSWQDFLANRYPTVRDLNDAYGLPLSSRYAAFTQIPFPAALPVDGARLVDWYEFEGVFLLMQRTAHYFTVMLPTAAILTDAERQERIEIAERVINLEKPAHTRFDLKYYWAMFRVGEARLGEDTLIDQGSRTAGMMPPFVLGRDYLSEGYLSPGHPQDVPDRLVLDRDRLHDSDTTDSHHI